MKRVDIQRFAVIDALKSSQLNFSIDELHGIENELHIQDIKIELESYINKYRGCGLKIDYRTNSIEKSQNIQKIAKYIDELEATKFEKYVALLVKIFDYELTFATKKSHDQGIDFMGIKKFKLFDSNRKSYLIGQAKKYNSLVDINEIRGFAGSVLLLRNREFSQAKKVYEDIDRDKILIEFEEVDPEDDCKMELDSNIAVDLVMLSKTDSRIDFEKITKVIECEKEEEENDNEDTDENNGLNSKKETIE